MVVVNPLPNALAHYQVQLLETIERSGTSTAVSVVPSPSIDQIRSSAHRAKALVQLLVWRTLAAFRFRDATILVVWPALGFLDVLSWVPCLMTHRVIVVMHDPSPLGVDNKGHGRWPVRIARLIARIPNLTFLTHTRTAADELDRVAGISSVIVGHPMMTERNTTDRDHPSTGRHIRVFGRYKQSRNLVALSELASDTTTTTGARLSIHGRGWPTIDGWQVDDRFVSDTEFKRLIHESACVIVPYSKYFQSGVAVRALESGVPVVGPRTEHLIELYGGEWPGLVGDGESWTEAVRRVCELPIDLMARIRRDAGVRIDESWRALVSVPSMVIAS